MILVPSFWTYMVRFLDIEIVETSEVKHSYPPDVIIQLCSRRSAMEIEIAYLVLGSSTHTTFQSELEQPALQLLQMERARWSWFLISLACYMAKTMQLPREGLLEVSCSLMDVASDLNVEQSFSCLEYCITILNSWATQTNRRDSTMIVISLPKMHIAT